MATNDLLIRLLARNETKGAVNEVRNSLSSLTGIAAGFGVALSAGMFARFSAEAVTMAANAEQIEGAFRNLTASVGLSADVLLGSLERVAGGVATNAQLMQTANLALQGGTVELVNQLPRLFEVARAAAVASGQDVLYVYDTLVRGIIRGSPLLIDNANIFVKIGDAQEQFAQSIGKTVEELSAQEKQLSLLNAVMGDAERIIQATGVSSDSAAAQIKSMAVATEELKTAWGELLLQAGVGNAVGGIAEFIAGQTAVIRDFGDFLAMSAEFAARGMDEEAAAAQKAAEAVRRMGSDTANSLPWVKALAGQYEVMIKLTKPAEAGVRATTNAMARAVLPTMQWGDALAMLNQELAKTAMIGSGPMSQAGPVSDLIKNQSSLSDAMNLTVDEWVAGMLAANETISSDSKTTAQAVANNWQSAYNSIQGSAESALTARMQPTELDFLQTGLGTYQDAPLENVRRLDAIIQRGMEEISAHPDWAAILEIPADVLAGGGDALKAWAMQTRESVANLARPDLINWDAFIAEFQRQQQDAAAKALTLDIAMGKLAQAGLLGEGNQAAQKAQIAQMLGLDTPELAAASIAEGFQTAFAANNPATVLLGSIQTKVGTQETAYAETGKKAGDWIGSSIKSAALLQLDGFLPDLAARLSPYLTLPGGNPPP